MAVIKSGEHVHLAQLLQFLDLGEQLAHDCANAQVDLASDYRLKAFLAGQAKQEGRHAMAFQLAIRWLSPRAVTSPLVFPHMNQYRRLIMAAVERGDFAETLLGEQIILEGLGEAILRRMEAGLARRKAPFGRLRRMLLHQEEAHHSFGLRTLERMIAADMISIEGLKKAASPYVELGKSMLFAAQDAFQAIKEDPQNYWDDFQIGLPDWLQAHHRKPNLLRSTLKESRNIQPWSFM
ncbi:MAG: ferritin-like domain-containing protein [Nitrospirales bacterium]|nr:ferritin-like domain-containing protein [Nitrospirales bacterium]